MWLLLLSSSSLLLLSRSCKSPSFSIAAVWAATWPHRETRARAADSLRCMQPAPPLGDRIPSPPVSSRPFGLWIGVPQSLQYLKESRPLCQHPFLHTHLHRSLHAVPKSQGGHALLEAALDSKGWSLRSVFDNARFRPGSVLGLAIVSPSRNLSENVSSMKASMVEESTEASRCSGQTRMSSNECGKTSILTMRLTMLEPSEHFGLENEIGQLDLAHNYQVHQISQTGVTDHDEGRWVSLAERPDQIRCYHFSAVPKPSHLMMGETNETSCASMWKQFKTKQLR